MTLLPMKPTQLWRQWIVEIVFLKDYQILEWFLANHYLPFCSLQLWLHLPAQSSWYVLQLIIFMELSSKKEFLLAGVLKREIVEKCPPQRRVINAQKLSDTASIARELAVRFKRVVRIHYWDRPRLCVRLEDQL